VDRLDNVCWTRHNVPFRAPKTHPIRNHPLSLFGGLYPRRHPPLTRDRSPDPPHSSAWGEELSNVDLPPWASFPSPSHSISVAVIEFFSIIMGQAGSRQASLSQSPGEKLTFTSIGSTIRSIEPGEALISTTEMEQRG